MVESISTDELKVMNNINIIDIRANYKYKIAHIKDAINIEFNKLLLYPEKYIDKNKKYYIYCDKGLQSKQLCQILNKQGFKTVHVVGGYDAWKND